MVDGARALAGSDDAVRPVIGDASAVDDMAAAVALAEGEFGGLDAVVAVAGVIAGGVPLWKMPPEQQEAVFDANLASVLVASRVGIPALLRRPEPRPGRFVAVASAAATRGLPMLAAYCAAKAGVTGLVRALAAELRGTGVTANAVSPGSTATPILDESARLYGLESAEAFSSQQPIGRLIRPEEVAATICLARRRGARRGHRRHRPGGRRPVSLIRSWPDLRSGPRRSAHPPARARAAARPARRPETAAQPSPPP